MNRLLQLYRPKTIGQGFYNYLTMISGGIILGCEIYRPLHEKNKLTKCLHDKQYTQLIMMMSCFSIGVISGPIVIPPFVAYKLYKEHF